MNTRNIQGMIWSHIVTCRDCQRIFDMTKEEDVNEWSFGHDCEAI
jgi:hypothetical protein